MNLIDWTCDTCHAPTGGKGAISITYDEIHRADAVRRAEDFTHLTAEDALTRPHLGLWKVECNTCAGECISAYWIDLQRACTDRDLVEWTRHLSSKTWFAATNWDALVKSVARTTPALRRVI